jgi:hypothetical protein
MFVDAIGDQQGECRLAATGRPPEHHTVDPATPDRLAERLAAGEQMRLTAKVVQTAGTHAMRQRRGAGGLFGKELRVGCQVTDRV